MAGVQPRPAAPTNVVTQRDLTVERTGPEQGVDDGVCRLCGDSLRRVFVDLGMSPLCESYIRPDQLDAMEPFYPLRVFVCERCFLVQLKEYVSAESIFSDYAYFSSYSDSWVEHARRYVDAVSKRFDLGTDSLVVEVASNDGYLLQHFVGRDVPVLGVEPARNVADAARERGVPTESVFLGHESGQALASAHGVADLVVGNNVFAHVPDLHDFTAGLAALLSPTGVLTLEFPHLVRLMGGNQFDTIYHEHFSYFSFHTASQALARHGLAVFDVEELQSHGGSLRIYAQHEGGPQALTEAVGRLAKSEQKAGVTSIAYYDAFRTQVEETKRALLEFMVAAKREGKTIVGYGAPGKGNTLLNYCGIRTDFLDYTVDRSPHKQGLFLPGTRIPIGHPDRLAETRPDYVLILPWNLRDEIIEQLGYVRDWGGRFVVPIPEVRVYD
jgi:SAM-dependent methyltransferase